MRHHYSFVSQKRAPDYLDAASVAHQAVYSAVRDGTLLKPDVCSQCHKEPKGPIEGHHEDYSKPLEVVWVCKPCHRVLDHRLRERQGVVAPSEGYSGNTITHFRMEQDLRLKLEALSAETGFSISELVRACILRALPYVESKARQCSQAEPKEGPNV